ncbi:ISAzo13-like element transposase-related protein [Novipirellula maiorica]|uniref:ISAzo13-like element transposase-related protein n=1 Tax=Novipirellula maiorica TaxID=1265734 RepID=UPI001360B437
MRRQSLVLFERKLTPPYCSKYNPIDHRLFCHLSRAISRRLVESLDWMQLLFSRVTTTVGLKVICELARKAYRSGQKATESFRKNEPMIRDKVLGQFNYVLRP